MKLLCLLFGHKLPTGYAEGRPYLRLVESVTDGIGRRHANLYVKCDRCNEDWHVANVHLPGREINENRR